MSQIARLDSTMKRRSGSGGFQIEILHPGVPLRSADSGVGAFGRIDDSRVSPGTVVRMHPHKNDEILTYLRSGKLMHVDTVGNKEAISPNRLMLMNAGHTFQHEEEALLEGGPLRALQIFMRPRAADLEPAVQFHDFGLAMSRDAWRLVAGPGEDAPLRVSSQAWVHDMRLSAGRACHLPTPPTPLAVRILYVVSGLASVGGSVLAGGDALLLDAEGISASAAEDSDLVLFSTDPTAAVFTGGMFSGNVLSK